MKTVQVTEKGNEKYRRGWMYNFHQNSKQVENKIDLGWNIMQKCVKGQKKSKTKVQWGKRSYFEIVTVLLSNITMN